MKQIIKRLNDIYSQNLNEIVEKWNDYLTRANKRIERLQQQYDKEQTDVAKQKLINAKKSITLQNKWYAHMVDETTTKIAQINETAIAYLNEQILPVYAINYCQAYQDLSDINIGIDFGIVNENVIMRRILDNDIKTPYMFLRKYLNIPKDKRWNTRQLNSAVLQGILQGESMQEIAKRILPIVNNNFVAAVRNARTMVTGAENKGRQDSYTDLESRGLVLNKQWIATADSRTRDLHLVMDKQEIGIHDNFTDGNGNEIQYPGDPHAAPETVYNCRCAMRTRIYGFRNPDGSISYISQQKNTQSLHDKQIQQEEERRANGRP